MLSIKLNHVFVLVFIRFSTCERRIVDGQEITSDKAYMVYLIKAEESPLKYDTWLCGGVIISSWFILTSAACVEDVKYMYAIAGYKKYVQYNKLDSDECTTLVKRKIVLTCVPEAYDLKYKRLEKWSNLDISIVKVQKPYLFKDKSYDQEIAEHCSYKPNKIAINYDLKYEEPGVDAIMLGWGHMKNWRQIEDKTDYNQNILHYASTKVFPKNYCKSYFTKPDLSTLIDKYMICTFERSHLNDRGEMNRRKYPPGTNYTLGSSAHASACKIAVYCWSVRKIHSIHVANYVHFNALYSNAFDNSTLCFDSTRVHGRWILCMVMSNATQTNNLLNKVTLLDLKQVNETRRQGICQNDHGGPLITWVEGKERVIGVASVFRVNEHSECIPPYLFTSTALNKMFIECVLNEERKGRRSALCDQSLEEIGFKILRRHISWDYQYET